MPSTLLQLMLPQHIEYAAVHRDDSDSDEEDAEDIDDSSEGWEDEIGERVFPEENREEYLESSEDEEDPNYWTDDDTEDFEEEREQYYGFSRALASVSRAHHTHDAAVHAHQSPESRCGSKKAESHDAEKPASSGVSFCCPLCLEAPKETSATRCGHLFCTP